MNPKGSTFLFEDDKEISHEDFSTTVLELRKKLRGIGKRAFALEAKNHSRIYAKFFALLAEGHTVFPCPSYQFNDPDFRSFLEKETKTNFIFHAHDQDFSDELAASPLLRLHPLIAEEQSRAKSLFIVRTSGSSGKKYKFVLHDFSLFREKYASIGAHFKKTIAFSPFDSIAGIETVTEAYTHGLSLVLAGDRPNPTRVAKLIHDFQVDYFQTTPSFLKMMLIARQITAEKLGSLKKIAYGSEPSSLQTLEWIRSHLPKTELMHTYGMSEIGILATETCPSDPSRMRPREALNPWRLRNGEALEVRSMTRMLGYLNEEFEPNINNWFSTGDLAREEEGYLRVLGRNSDVINVAGRKFFPNELENLLLKMPGVLDATVFKQKHELVGESFGAELVIDGDEDESSFKARLKLYSEENIPFFMHPHRLQVHRELDASPRFKKQRIR